jgi:hypothetical protein
MSTSASSTCSSMLLAPDQERFLRGYGPEILPGLHKPYD